MPLELSLVTAQCPNSFISSVFLGDGAFMYHFSTTTTKNHSRKYEKCSPVPKGFMMLLLMMIPATAPWIYLGACTKSPWKGCSAGWTGTVVLLLKVRESLLSRKVVDNGACSGSRAKLQWEFRQRKPKTHFVRDGCCFLCSGKMLLWYQLQGLHKGNANKGTAEHGKWYLIKSMKMILISSQSHLDWPFLSISHYCLVKHMLRGAFVNMLLTRGSRD